MHRPSPERLLSCQVFPELQSQTYSEVIDDTAELVKPLQDNQDLQREFSSLLRKPHRDLLKLSNMLHALQEKIESGYDEERHDLFFPELLAHLSSTSTGTLDQVKALVTATEAFRDLPTVSVDCILDLQSEEISNLFLLFKRIPITSSAHGFSTPAMTDYDPIYSSLLSRIGFTDWKGHLLYEQQKGYSGLNKITLTIIAIHSVTCTAHA
jgi:hypothetical protein